MGNNSIDTATAKPSPIEFYRQDEATSPTQFPQQIALNGEFDSIALYQTVTTRLERPGDTISAAAIVNDLSGDA